MEVTFRRFQEEAGGLLEEEEEEGTSLLLGERQNRNLGGAAAGWRRPGGLQGPGTPWTDGTSTGREEEEEEERSPGGTEGSASPHPSPTPAVLLCLTPRLHVLYPTAPVGRRNSTRWRGRSPGALSYAHL